jgi:hypothetical protein
MVTMKPKNPTPRTPKLTDTIPSLLDDSESVGGQLRNQILDRASLINKAQPPTAFPPIPYVTLGTTANPKVAALEDAPNYAPSVAHQTSCEYCKAYKKEDDLIGYCDKYDFYARGDYSCDSWTSRNGALLRKRLSGF